MSETIDLAALTAANAADGDYLLGINGDSLKKVKVGARNGNICKMYEFPTRSTLKEEGCLDEDSATSVPLYMEAVLKYLVKKHTGGVFIGKGTPGTQGIMIAHLYDGGVAENGSGLPNYGSCLYFSLNDYYISEVIRGVFTAHTINTTRVQQ